MSLPALMALLGHVTPEITLRYAKVASPTIRDAYDTAMTKVRGRRPIYVIPARDPIAGACGYANICEQCDNFVPDPNRADVLEEQLADIHVLRDDAETRGWTNEAARHDRVTNDLEQHLHRLNRKPTDD